MIELLLSLILAFTGIGRTVDPELTAIAERRAVEVNTDATFSHAGQDLRFAEVLAWNLNYPDPVRRAAEQWRESPGHWAILTNRDFTRIGCGHALGPDGRHVFVCVLGYGVQPVQPESPVPPSEPVVVPEPAPVAEPAPVIVLPDTSMSG